MKVTGLLTKEQTTCYETGLRAVRSFENEERNLVENLIQAEDLKLPKAFELSSLFMYAVKILGLTESITGMIINVARKSNQISQLRAAIQNKDVSVSKAHKFCAVVTDENVQDWIQYASTHTSREIEDRVRDQNPTQVKSHKFKLSLNAEELLKRVQSLESQRQSRPVSKEEALEIALEYFVDRKDPVMRADRMNQKTKVKEKSSTASDTPPPQDEQFSGIVTAEKQKFAGMTSEIKPTNFHSRETRAKSRSQSSRKPITAEQRNAVMARTRGCCTYVNAQGQRCNEDKWIDIHHIKPVKEGGTNDIENLTVLCGFHHDLVHQLEIPLEEESHLISQRTSGQTMHL